MLGDFGADVIKVERPGTGDVYRRMGNLEYRGENASFLMINRSKRSVAIDVKSARGNAIIRKLVRTADVLVQNFRPGRMRALGLDYESVQSESPSIIYCSISAFGDSGPYAEKAGTDPVIQAMSGVMAITGEPGRSPVLIGPPVGDFNAAVIAVQGILLALYHRQATGQGQEVRVSLLNASVFSLGPRAAHPLLFHEDLKPLGNRHPLIAPNEIFTTSDGFIHVSTLDDDSWKRLCIALHREDLLVDQRFTNNGARVRHRDALNAELAMVFETRAADDWVETLDKNDVLCAAVRNLNDVMADMERLDDEMVVSVRHETVGDMRVLGNPIRLSKSRVGVVSGPPVLGGATQSVLEELGYSSHEIEQLASEGSVQVGAENRRQDVPTS
jgi:formyl-CoA transferase